MAAPRGAPGCEPDRAAWPSVGGHDRDARQEAPAMTTDRTPPRAIDPDKLMAFVFRAVDEVGATLNTRPRRDGRQARLLPRCSPSGPLTAGRAGRAHRHRRALRPGVAQRPGRRRLRRATTRPPAATPCRPSTPSRSPTRPARRTCPASSRSRYGTVRDADSILGRGPRRRRGRLARAQRRRARRLRAVLPDRCTTANLVDEWLPALDGVVAKLEARRPGRRHRLRPRRVDRS